MAQAEKPIQAHLFSHGEPGRRPSDVVSDAAKLLGRGVTFAGRFVGSFSVYAHVEADALKDLQDLIDGPLWDAGFRSDWSLEVQRSQIMGPKRGSPDHCALVRVRPEGDPFDLLGRLDDHFGPLYDGDTYWYGAAVVSGRGYDLLVDLGRPTWDQLRAAVLEDLRGVAGIAGTDTSVAYLPGNAVPLQR